MHEIFQARDSVRQVADRVGFREAGFFGKQLAYTMHFEKVEQAQHLDLEN